MPAKKSSAKKPKNDKPKSPAAPAKDSPSEKRSENFPVVGLGASAGGLDALRAFFAEVPPDSGMAYIVVVHLSPRKPSMMAELLQKVTPIPATTAGDGLVVEPDHIYVVPPDKDLRVFHGRLQLLDVVEKHVRLPIDAFLRSLALDQGPRAAAVILSGTGTDGTLGAKEIKASDGLVVVQSEETAGYNGMPRSAILSGTADMVLAPREMPGKLAHYFAHLNGAMVRKLDAGFEAKGWLDKIFGILRTHVGHDFSQYKINTLLRRVNRRMGLNQIQDHGLYVGYLRENSREVEALFRELLIGVTSFFRDAESFRVLKSDILPEILGGINEDGTIRVWVPGCSTGEEVYSLAMVIRELLAGIEKRINVQLFGTDIDNLAIEKAREGSYPASIAADVSEERLKRFFIRDGDYFRVRNEIRDCAVFSVQNVIKDPPFSHLHLLCCRNLLIYLDGDAQKKLLPLFHYTLTPGGILVLGSSETIGGFNHLFETLDQKWKIFRRRELTLSLRHPIDFPTTDMAAEPEKPGVYDGQKNHEKIDFSRLARRALLDQCCPPAVFVDAQGHILHIQGRTGKYLEAPSGPPTQNIRDMARSGLRIELSSALRQARTSGQPVTRRRIGVQTNGDRQWIDLHVQPQRIPRQLAGTFLVIFQDVAAVSGGEEHTAEGPTAHMLELERELHNARESHQGTVEELESSNEELKSTNEELQSANEELQSTNEELESSKEELQSLNEELQTVNAELQSKVDDLQAAQDDMRNLFNSTEIATIFVDNDLHIRRFTPEATALVNLIQSDIGRPLQHVVTNLGYQGMIDDLEIVLNKLTPREAEVQTTAGRWYKMRITPYRTTNNRIDGAVLTFINIHDQKEAQQVLRTAKEEMERTWGLIRNVFDMNPDPLAVLGAEGRLVIANTAFADLMKVAPDKIQGMDAFKVIDDFLGNLGASAEARTALKKGKDFQVHVGGAGRSQGAGKYLIRGQAVDPEDERSGRTLLHIIRES